MEIVRRPTRLSELPVHPQLVRYLAQAGEFFAVVAEGTEYERDLTPRFPGRALSADKRFALEGCSMDIKMICFFQFII